MRIFIFLSIMSTIAFETVKVWGAWGTGQEWGAGSQETPSDSLVVLCT